MYQPTSIHSGNLTWEMVMDLLPWTVLNKPGDIREAKYIICTRAFACLVKERFFFFFGRNLRAAPLIKKDCSLGFYCFPFDF